MSDGASQGIGPQRALDTVLGGKPAPEKDEGLELAEMERKIRKARLGSDEELGYEGCGWACARIVLEYLEHHPEDVGAPIDNLYDWDRWKADGQPQVLKPYLLTDGLYERIKRKDEERGKQLENLGLTGFLWGWGFNAAVRVMGQPTQPNPAILEL
jgi:hypothetical protein